MNRICLKCEREITAELVSVDGGDEVVEGFDRPPRLVERLDQEQLLELVETPES